MKFLALIAFLFCSLASAQTRVNDPIPLLNEEVSLMQSIQGFLNAPDRTRMSMLIVYTQKISERLQDPQYGLGHEETADSFKDQISAIDTADSFFRSIRNRYTGNAIDRIQEIQATMVNSFGFNRKGYAKNLNRVLKQIEFQLRQLYVVNIPDQLKHKIEALLPVLADATVKASPGDTRIAYSRAGAVASAITSMYDEFAQLSESRTIFEVALMLQFLNERLVSYGQYDLDQK